MADDNTSSETPQPATGSGSGNGADAQGPQAGIMAQYIKDLSFENPEAPKSLQQMGDQQPKIEINVNVTATQTGEETYEVSLQVTATANHEDKKIFIVELVYAGLFAIRNVDQQNLQLFLLIECPRILFPFARRILADVTRDGGLPPLMLDPIDFSALYQQHMANQQAAAAPEASA